FVLWVLYVCYLLLRTLIDEPERRAVVSAVFGIFAAFDVPLVYFSIWFFRTQHPQPVLGAGGSLDPRMLDVLLLCWAATLALLVSSRKKPWTSRRFFGLEKSGGKMKNLGSLMAAYLAVWAIFFVYHFTVARRVARLQDEIARLKQSLKQ